MAAIDNQIEAQRRKMEVLDHRIGRLMSQRVDLEEKMAALLDKKNGITPLSRALKTIMSPEFDA